MERKMKTNVKEMNEKRIKLAIRKHARELDRLILMLKKYEKQGK
jgi:hypothetical protein